MFLDEGVQRSLRAILKNKVIIVRLLDDLIAFNDVGVVQLLMNFHFLLQQCEVLFILTNFALVHYLYGEIPSGIVN
jgi:hypothetical protein